MAAPLVGNGIIEIDIIDKLISKPYVEMTIKLMKKFGVEVNQDEDLTKISINANQIYSSPGNIFVEGDASSASYFLAGAAITGGTVTVSGCGIDSVQGDVRFAYILEKMGAKLEINENSITITGKGKLKAVEEDCVDIPDAAMTLAVVALFAEG